MTLFLSFSETGKLPEKLDHCTPSRFDLLESFPNILNFEFSLRNLKHLTWVYDFIHSFRLLFFIHTPLDENEFFSGNMPVFFRRLSTWSVECICKGALDIWYITECICVHRSVTDFKSIDNIYSSGPSATESIEIS